MIVANIAYRRGVKDTSGTKGKGTMMLNLLLEHVGTLLEHGPDFLLLATGHNCPYLETRPSQTLVGSH